jgi:hypothetical protein
MTIETVEREVAYQITPDGGKPYVTPDMAEVSRMLEHLMDCGLAFRVEYVYMD